MSKKIILYFVLVACALITAFVKITFFNKSSSNETLTHIFEQQGIEKSPNDANQYQYLQLKNGLKVLLISDPETEKASAALNVSVGYRQDPKAYPGLAHFLEHMLFLGTTPFPKPGEYKDFIAQHGGTHNAFTSFENTQYYFDIHSDYLEPALKRFSAFFTAPLFNQEFVKREIHAVHSEFQASYRDDGRRIYSTLKRVLNQEHPFTKFSTGNLTSLNASEPDALRKEMMAFYKQFYQPQRMSLVVYGKEPIARLKTWAESLFNPIDASNYQPTLPIKTALVDSSKLPMDIQIKPLDQRRVLTLLFPLDQAYGMDTSKSLEWLLHIINLSGGQSLEEALKQKGWILGLGASQSFRQRDRALLSVEIQLTPLGAQHRNDITQQVMAFIEHIKSSGLPKWQYEEKKLLANIAYLYQKKQQPIHVTGKLASRLALIKEPSHIVSLPYRYDGINKPQLEHLLSQLTINNMLRVFVSPDAQTDDIEPLYQVHFSKTSSHLPDVAAATLWPNIALPQPNPYIPELNGHQSDIPASNEFPVELSNSPLYHFHASDFSFKTPRANTYLRLDSANLQSPTAHHLAMHYFISHLTEDSIQQALAQAGIAGLYGGLSARAFGIDLYVQGYYSKSDMLLKTLLMALKSPNWSQQRFIDIKERIIEQFEDHQKRRPYQQAFRKLSQAILPYQFDEETLARTLRDLSLEEIKRYHHFWLQQLNASLLTHGSLSKRQALERAHLIESILSPKKAPPQNVLANRLENNSDILFYPKHSDHVVLRYQQAPDLDAKTITRHSQRVAWALLGRLMQPSFFEQLRTKEQLGYIVSAGPKPFISTAGLFFLVQSPKVNATQLDTRIVRFIKEYKALLEAIDDSQIQKHKEGLINDLLEKPKTLADKGDKLWTAFTNQKPFNESEVLADATKALSKQDLINALEALLNGTSHSLSIKTDHTKNKEML